MRIDWGAPKISISEFEAYLSSYLGEQYDGIRCEGNYLYVVTYTPLNEEQEIAINEYIYLLNDSPKTVRTQFERDDLILKIAKAKADVDIDGVAVVEIKIPGVMADDGCRWIDGGKAFFDVGHAGDAVIEVAIVDKDNVLGYGSNTVLKTYHDDECDAINQGWYIYPTRPLEIETLGYYGKIPSELYLIIKAKKAAGHESGTFFVSLDWGVIG